MKSVVWKKLNVGPRYGELAQFCRGPLLRHRPTTSGPGMKSCRSQQLAAIGFPLPCAQQLAEHIPTSPALLVTGRRSKGGLLVGTGHD